MSQVLWVPQGPPGACLRSLCHSDGRGEAQDAIFLCSLNSSAGLPYPYTLQEVQVGIINTTMCNHLFSMPDFRTDIWGDMICAGDPQGGKDSCFVSVPPVPSSRFWAHSTSSPQAPPSPPRPENTLHPCPPSGPRVHPGGRGRDDCSTLQMQKLRLAHFCGGEVWDLHPVCPAP